MLAAQYALGAGLSSGYKKSKRERERERAKEYAFYGIHTLFKNIVRFRDCEDLYKPKSRDITKYKNELLPEKLQFFEVLFLIQDQYDY